MLTSVKCPFPGRHSGNNFVCISHFIFTLIVAERSKVNLWGHSLDWDCRVLSRLGHGFLYLVNVVCCQVEVSATSWSLVQRSHIECLCVSGNECDWLQQKLLHLQRVNRSQAKKESTFFLTHSCRMIYTADPPSVTHIWRSVQTMELVNNQFSPTSCYFRSFTSKFSLFPLLLSTQNFPLGHIMTRITGTIFYCPKSMENKLILNLMCGWPCTVIQCG